MRTLSLALAALLLAAPSASAVAQSGVSFEILSNPAVFGLNQGQSVPPAVIGDFNGDGIPDLVTSGYASGQALAFQAGSGQATFASPVTAYASSSTDMEVPLLAADLNNDGHLDLVAEAIPSGTGNEIPQVFLGNGDGTFQPPVSLTAAQGIISVALGDFNGDGLPDIAVGHEAVGTATTTAIQIFRNLGGGSFTLVQSVPLDTTYGVFSLNAADIDMDGHVDLVAGNSSSLVVLWGQGNFQFTPATLETYPGDHNLTIQTAVADVNQDGSPDILVTASCDTSPMTMGKGPSTNGCVEVDVFYGGQGKSTTYYRQAFADSSMNVLNSTMAVDVNGDGIADLVGSGEDENGNAAGIYVWLGHPDGSFDTQKQRFIQNSAYAGPMLASDLNRDGRMDFLIPSENGGSNSSIFLNATPIAPCATSAISPTTIVCQPVDHTFVALGQLHIAATAFDTTPVTAMQEYIDGALTYSQPVTNFDIAPTLGVGEHLLVTKSWDASGRNFLSPRSIIVYSNGAPGPTCAAPANGGLLCFPNGLSTKYQGNIRVVANGSTQAVPTAAQLYVDGSLVLNDTTQSTALDTPVPLSPGSHQLVFKLWDASGNVATTTSNVEVTNN